ncbi:MAG: hypothetical protein CM1200mP23_0370 [Nitrososphaerota archaeon]|nr:MAG: hypothetical protein CM1200mP23_0370 [Nitrososphaerota archaeon]
MGSRDPLITIAGENLGDLILVSWLKYLRLQFHILLIKLYKKFESSTNASITVGKNGLIF